MSKYSFQINRIWEKTLKKNSNTHYLKNSQTIFYQINGIWVKDSKRINRIHII
jgi:hypothetical protein